LKVGMSLKKADGLLIFCSNDLRVAEYAAELFHKGFTPWICASGGVGRLTYDLFHKPEAEAFAEVLRSKKVPENAILTESRSTNTAENIFFTREILNINHIYPHSLLVLQKPYMERRTLAAITQYWPEMKATISSPPIPFESYPFPGFSIEDLVHVIVGDFQRVDVYAARGWQTPQPIPVNVWNAYHALVEAGFTRELVDGNSLPSKPPNNQ